MNFLTQMPFFLHSPLNFDAKTNSQRHTGAQDVPVRVQTDTAIIGFKGSNPSKHHRNNATATVAAISKMNQRKLSQDKKGNSEAGNSKVEQLR